VNGKRDKSNESIIDMQMRYNSQGNGTACSLQAGGGINRNTSKAPLKRYSQE